MKQESQPHLLIVDDERANIVTRPFRPAVVKVRVKNQIERKRAEEAWRQSQAEVVQANAQLAKAVARVQEAALRAEQAHQAKSESWPI